MTRSAAITKSNKGPLFVAFELGSTRKNAGCGARLRAGTDRRLSRRIKVVEEFSETTWNSPARSMSFASSTVF